MTPPKRVSNTKETRDGVTFYYMRRIVDGVCYGLDIAFIDVQMEEPGYVAWKLRRARTQLRDAYLQAVLVVPPAPDENLYVWTHDAR